MSIWTDKKKFLVRYRLLIFFVRRRMIERRYTVLYVLSKSLIKKLYNEQIEKKSAKNDILEHVFFKFSFYVFLGSQ